MYMQYIYPSLTHREIIKFKTNLIYIYILYIAYVIYTFNIFETWSYFVFQAMVELGVYSSPA